jgi:membrane-associated protease RseP (regulator of RpoE activity)
MGTALLYALGILIFALGLLFSIAWHELGHLTFAKLFNVRVSQYMIGFGKTLWSRQKGETEYGIKAVPLGGYIRMIGMVPPGKDGRQRITSTSANLLGMARQIVEDSRAGDRAGVTPADEGRQFYQLHPFKRIVVMLAGPVQNLILAVILFGIVMVGIGVPTANTTLQSVSACIIPVAAAGQPQRTTCQAGDQPTPAAQVGLQPNDVLVSFDGQPIENWDQVKQVIAASGGKTVELDILRDGKPMTLSVPLVATQRPIYDDNGVQTGTAVIGFLGVSPQETYVAQNVGSAFVRTGQFIGMTAAAVVGIPARIPALFSAIFHTSEKRAENSPVGIIGAGRIGGEILASDADGRGKLALVLNLLAGFNMSLFLLNLLPLLPLDGGHILGASIEWVRRGWARLRRRPLPAPFDVATLMPVAYVVALLFIGLTVLTAVADIVNPVTLSG